jgi:hypothetical protein
VFLENKRSLAPIRALDTARPSLTGARDDEFFENAVVLLPSKSILIRESAH